MKALRALHCLGGQRLFSPNRWLLISLVVSTSLAVLADEEETKSPVASMSLMEAIDSIRSASKRPQPISEAPSSVSVLQREDFQKYGYRTLAEALQSVPGLYVTSDRSRSFLGVRGFNRGDYNSRVLLLINGHRLNNNLSDGAFVGTDFPLDVDLIKKVEIIRGPGSVLYGDNAFFAVVNVITRQAEDLAADGAGGAEFSGEYGSYESYKGRVTYGFTNQLALLLSGTFYNSAGPDNVTFDLAALDHQKLRVKDNEDDHFRDFFGALSYKDFTLEGAFATRAKMDPTAPSSTADALTQWAKAVDERSYANLRFDHKFTDIVDVNALVYYDRYDLKSDQFYDLPLFLRGLQVGEWWGSEVQATRQFFEEHPLTLTLGAEYRDDFRQQQQTFSDDFLVDTHKGTRESYGVYLQSELRILDNLLLSAGARYDSYSTFGDTANPRVALIYKPFKDSTLKAIYGTAFRGPNFYEIRFNNDLAPETIRTYELVYEQAYTTNWSSALSAYYNQIEDLITLQTVHSADYDTLTFENIKGAEARGVEAELRGTWDHGFGTRLSYAFQQTEDRRTHHTLTDSPQHLGKLNLSAPVFNDKLFADLEFQYVSKRTTLLDSDAAGYGLVNFTLFSPNLVKGLDLSASVYNLFDNHYADPATPFHLQALIPGNERSFRLKLTYRF